MATDVPMDGRCLLMCGRGGPKAPGLVPVVHTTCPGHKTPWDKAWAWEAAKGPLRCFSRLLHELSQVNCLRYLREPYKPS